MASVSAASGRSPRSPGLSRTSAAGWTSANSSTPARLASNLSEWRHYAVDGERRRADRAMPTPADSAATLAREIWAHGSLRAGVFAHNQAEWFVQAVLARSRPHAGPLQDHLCRLEGRPACRRARKRRPDGDPGQRHRHRPEGRPAGGQGRDRRRQLDLDDALYLGRRPSAPCTAPGYDCSGAVSFALFGAGLLEHPLTSGALESYGEPGSGPLDHDLRQRHTRLRGDRRAALGHRRAMPTGRARAGTPNRPTRPGFVVRHPPGY